MTDKDSNRSKSIILPTLVSALIVVVGIQAWFMADMKKQLDDLRAQASTNAPTAQQAQQQVKPPEPVIEAPQQPAPPPAKPAPDWPPRSLFEDNWFNQPPGTRSWDPHREIQRMQREMDLMFNDAFGRFNYVPDFPDLPRGSSVTPDIDLKDEGDKYIALVDLPGADENDISVKLEDQVLTISGKQHYQQQNRDSHGNITFRERRSGSFRRSVSLPDPVKESGMKTELDNGVLKITIPKAG